MARVCLLLQPLIADDSNALVINGPLAIADGMRIIQPVQGTRYGPWPAVGLRLVLALAWATSAAAAMESSAELQALGYEPIRPGAASISTSSPSSSPPGESASTVTAGGTPVPPRSDWKYKRTKVKRRQQRLNSHSNLPGSTNASHAHHLLNLPPRQRYLKVNQVFESERRMSPAEMQRNHGKIVLLGLFELSTSRGPRPDGLSELGAATMAVEHINRKRLLPGYTLELVTNDTQVRMSFLRGVTVCPTLGATSRRRCSITKLNFHSVARATLKLNKKICNNKNSADSSCGCGPKREANMSSTFRLSRFYCDESLPVLMGHANVQNTVTEEKQCH